MEPSSANLSWGAAIAVVFGLGIGWTGGGDGSLTGSIVSKIISSLLVQASTTASFWSTTTGFLFLIKPKN